MKSSLFSARKTAWKVLNQCNILRHDTGEVLNEYLPKTDRPGQATDIIFGVVRNRGTIDTIIQKCGRLEQDHVKPNVWNLLRIGVYELVYAPKTADYGILNEVVELASQGGSKKTAGFVNAVLRNVQRMIQDRQVELINADPKRALPVDAQSGCLFTFDLLADPHENPAQYLSRAFSMPYWLVEHWLEAFGFEQTKSICLASNRHPSIVVQPNLLLTNAEDLQRTLTEQGIECELSADKTMCRIQHAGKINKNKAFLDGLFLIQDATASEAMQHLDPKTDWVIADLCSAPGGKAMTLAMLMNDEGMIFASDVDAKRLQRVRENAKRMRMSSIEVVLPNHIESLLKKQKRIDAIVLDVPCSNTGVLSRRIEARWRLKPNAVNDLVQTQQQLLEKAVLFSRSGMRLVYSTCSIEFAENQQQIQQFLSQHREFVLESEQLTLPVLKSESLFDHDGGYVAILKRK